MHLYQYEIGNVLRIQRKGQEVIARVAGYDVSLDNDNPPLLVNLRVSEGQRWGQRTVKVYKKDILEALPNWEAERKAQWEAELSAYVEKMWAKMSDAEKRRVHEDAVKLGLGRERRIPLDIMIDRACGREL